MSIVDLKAAYLQLRVDMELWRYQLVKYNVQTFCLTRLDFGLNSAPRIMSKVLKHVLSIDDTIKNATSSYIDDILVDETKISVTEVVSHLNKFGLITKAPEALDGGAVLGLRLSKVGEELMFHRGNKIPKIADALTRRELFSACGTLVGHYPIAGCLRVACSYMKRRAERSHWEDFVGEHAMSMIREVIKRVKVCRRSSKRKVVAFCTKEIDLVCCPSNDMLADIFTKGQSAEKFSRLRRKLGVVFFEKHIQCENKC
ncbi:hypothetical protein FHG87_020672 [Trinorchestia longiramus]|nr:hypothetical protein FHG87_020672 [Trinorchestia longiramus]